jgi:hypothetical protein
MIGKKINQLATELAPESTDLTIIGDPTTGVSKKITLAQLGAIFSGAVSFYNDLASFPVSGDINVIYCAKDTQKLYLWTGSAYTEVFPSQALLDTYQLRSEKGNANGYASLDSGGKVPISQLPSSIMEYKGTWNAATNTPTLANGTGDTGDVYICNVAGTVNFGAGPITFAVGDYTIYSGSIWQRSSGAVGTVTSVAASITGDSVTISGSPVTTSGTLAFAFNGTTAQYIRGNGTLETFPSLTGFVPYTGATANVDLGTHTLLAAKGIFSSSGSGDTVGITHSSGSGISLNITKGGNGEGLYINKTSGSGNAATIIGTLNATTLVKSGGTSSQFLKADGSVDSTAYGTGSVTSVAALTIGTTGTDLSSTVANGTTTPVITLNVPTASATNRGALSSTDWTTFNNKQNALTNPITGISASGRVAYFNGDTSITGSSNFFWDSTNNRLGIGLNNPQRTLEIHNATADSQLRISGAAPSVSLGEAITGAIYQAKFGLITANGQYVTGGVAGDFVMISQTGATIFATSSTEKMRVQASGNVSIGNTNDTYKLDVSGTGRFTQFLYLNSASNTAGAQGLLFYNSGPNTGSRSWRLSNDQINWGDFAIQVSTTQTGSTYITPLNIASSGAATFSSSVSVKSPSTSSNSFTANYSNSNQMFQLFEFASGIDAELNLRNSAGTSINRLSTNGNSYFNGGNVGIGTANPSSLLHTSGSSNIFKHYTTANNGTWIEFQSNSAGRPFYVGQDNSTGASFFGAGYAGLIVTGTADPILFGTNSTERMRITSGGNVGIGTNNPSSISSFNRILHIDGGANNSCIALSGNSLAGQANIGYDNSILYIDAIGAATGANNTITFNTTNVNSSTTRVERMRITSGGNVLMGKTTTGAVLNNGFEFNPSTNYISTCTSVSADTAAYISNTGTSGTRFLVRFYGTSSEVGRITHDGTNTSYVTSSDYRLKEDLKSYNGLDLIGNIKTYDYQWKYNKERMYGVLAHELAEVLPYAVSGIKDGEIMQGVDYSKIVPVLIKAIQELNDKIK